MNIELEKILFVGPHPDDVELGCAGIISKYSTDTEIKYLILSPCTDDPKNNGILSDVEKAIKHIGLTMDDLIIKNIPRRFFGDYRQDIRQAMIDIRDNFQPNLVFCPSLRDVHQDHSITSEETVRLFRDVNIVSYEAIRSSIFFQPDLYIELTSDHVEAKLKALNEYKTQFDRYYFKPDVIKSLMRTRGNQARVDYAEAFEIYRLII